MSAAGGAASVKRRPSPAPAHDEDDAVRHPDGPSAIEILAGAVDNAERRASGSGPASSQGSPRMGWLRRRSHNAGMSSTTASGGGSPGSTPGALHSAASPVGAGSRRGSWVSTASREGLPPSPSRSPVRGSRASLTVPEPMVDPVSGLPTTPPASLPAGIEEERTGEQEAPPTQQESRSRSRFSLRSRRQRRRDRRSSHSSISLDEDSTGGSAGGDQHQRFRHGSRRHSSRRHSGSGGDAPEDAVSDSRSHSHRHHHHHSQHHHHHHRHHSQHSQHGQPRRQPLGALRNRRSRGQELRSTSNRSLSAGTDSATDEDDRPRPETRRTSSGRLASRRSSAPPSSGVPLLSRLRRLRLSSRSNASADVPVLTSSRDKLSDGASDSEMPQHEREQLCENMLAAVYADRPADVQALLDGHSDMFGDINAPLVDGTTILFNACAAGAVQVATFLLDKAGADVEADTPHGHLTPLHVAAHQGHVEIVKLLGSHGAHTDRVAAYGMSALMMAAAAGNVEVVQWLMQHSSLQRASADGRTAFFLACQHNHVAVAKLLWGASCGGELLARAAYNGSFPVHAAASAGATTVLEWLLNDTSVDVDAPDRLDQTPLFVAAEGGHLQTVRSLLRFGASPSHPRVDGACPLHACCWNGHVEVAAVLVAAGAAVNHGALDASGATPLLLAIQNSHEALCCWLVDCGGADAMLPSSRGTTPLRLAAKIGHVPIMRALLRAALAHRSSSTPEEGAATLSPVLARQLTGAIKTARRFNHAIITDLLEQVAKSGQLPVVAEQPSASTPPPPSSPSPPAPPAPPSPRTKRADAESQQADGVETEGSLSPILELQPPLMPVEAPASGAASAVADDSGAAGARRLSDDARPTSPEEVTLAVPLIEVTNNTASEGTESVYAASDAPTAPVASAEDHALACSQRTDDLQSGDSTHGVQANGTGDGEDAIIAADDLHGNGTANGMEASRGEGLAEIDGENGRADCTLSGGDNAISPSAPASTPASPPASPVAVKMDLDHAIMCPASANGASARARGGIQHQASDV